MGFQGYPRFADINGGEIVFTAEDDLWIVPAEGGEATRLTATAGAATAARFSPDGGKIAYVDTAEGQPELYLLDRGGGEPRRLTFEGGMPLPAAWSADGAELVYSSSRAQPSPRMRRLSAVPAAGGDSRFLPWGIANGLAYGPRGLVVLGRNLREPAYWKRYRGGTAGHFWIDRSGRGEFERFLQNLDGNLTSPCWAGGRFWFISDHEGNGAVYSCDASGDGVRRHSPLSGFYARNLRSDGRRLVYHSGGELFLLDAEEGVPRPVKVTLPGSRTQLSRRFAPAGRFLDSWNLHPRGHLMALADRGKAFSFGNWEGAVIQHGEADGVRYRWLRWLADGERLAAVRDDGGEPRVAILDGSGEIVLEGLDVGHVLEMEASPTADLLLLSNHRHEIMVVDLAARSARVVDRSEHAGIEDTTAMCGLAWSADGSHAAWSLAVDPRRSVIKLADVETWTVRAVTEPVGRDFSPSFDPEGRYLHFIGFRCFDPVFDAHAFNLAFPRGARPYLVLLRKDLRSPFLPLPEPEKEEGAKVESGSEGAQEKQGPTKVLIDHEGILDRVLAYPVPEGRYARVAGVSGGAVFSSTPVEGMLDDDIFEGPAKPNATLERWDWKARKRETVEAAMSDFAVTPDGKRLLVKSGERLRVLKADERPAPEGKPPAEDKPGRESGWLDLERVKVAVKPAAEWRQMLREAWRLQRENFWTADMSGVDWQAVLDAYLPLVDRITSRGELSDLIWEMQGELGTSHAYEIGGDYRPTPSWGPGFLGVDWRFDPAKGAWTIERVLRGDPWIEGATSPLLAAGAAPGDRLIAVNGRKVSAATGPRELLVNQAEREVELLLEPAGGGEPRRLTVKTLAREYGARYRDWVEANRRRVREASDGRLGYLHIPDMWTEGFSEFHRAFLAERDREGLVVDVRWNGGGSVSSLLLEKLARRRLGYSFTRRSPPEAYPWDSPRGPLVALTDENAGSDGDIFSHAFKMMGLGPLVGKRTWGGVVGITPLIRLSDGSLTTQPEFSFWFKDAGWGVENRGTDPDIEVDYRPQDYAAGADPQLERAIAEALRLVREKPEPVPAPAGRPRLGRKDAKGG